MKRLILVLALLWPMGLLADLQAGADAYKRGDYATAHREWLPLAEQGDAKAQFNLGAMYDLGVGVPTDDVVAVQWYLLAAAQGDAEARFNLALMYQYGEGVPKNDTEAAKWFRLAAEQGDAKAQYNLGLMYAKGEGVPQDYVTAYAWFDLAEAQGIKFAAESRDKAQKLMTPDQIAAGEKLSRELFERLKN